MSQRLRSLVSCNDLEEVGSAEHLVWPFSQIVAYLFLWWDNISIHYHFSACLFGYLLLVSVPRQISLQCSGFVPCQQQCAEFFSCGFVFIGQRSEAEDI